MDVLFFRKLNLREFAQSPSLSSVALFSQLLSCLKGRKNACICGDKYLLQAEREEGAVSAVVTMLSMRREEERKDEGGGQKKGV